MSCSKSVWILTFSVYLSTLTLLTFLIVTRRPRTTRTRRPVINVDSVLACCTVTTLLCCVGAVVCTILCSLECDNISTIVLILAIETTNLLVLCLNRNRYKAIRPGESSKAPDTATGFVIMAMILNYMVIAAILMVITVAAPQGLLSSATLKRLNAIITTSFWLRTAVYTTVYMWFEVGTVIWIWHRRTDQARYSRGRLVVLLGVSALLTLANPILYQVSKLIGIVGLVFALESLAAAVVLASFRVFTETMAREYSCGVTVRLGTINSLSEALGEASSPQNRPLDDA